MIALQNDAFVPAGAVVLLVDAVARLGAALARDHEPVAQQLRKLLVEQLTLRQQLLALRQDGKCLSACVCDGSLSRNRALRRSAASPAGDLRCGGSCVQSQAEDRLNERFVTIAGSGSSDPDTRTHNLSPELLAEPRFSPCSVRFPRVPVVWKIGRVRASRCRHVYT